MRMPYWPGAFGVRTIVVSMLALGLGLFRYSLWPQDRQRRLTR